MPKTGVDAKRKERMDNALKAIQELTSEERENLLDYLALQEAKKGPSRPFEEYLGEWEAKQNKKTRK